MALKKKYLTNGDDTLKLGSDNYEVFGYKGNDTIKTQRSTDSIIHGGQGNDFLKGGNSCKLYGDDGNDTIIGHYGNTSMYGGKGDDIFWDNDKQESNGTAKYYIDAGSGNDKVDLTKNKSAKNSATIYCGNGKDYVKTGNLADKIYGGAGNDTIYAGGGNDLISAGTGRDCLYGGAGNDTYQIQAAKGNVATINDNSGKEKIQVFGVNNVKKLADLNKIKFTLSKDKKTLAVKGINGRTDNVFTFTTTDKFSGDTLQLFNSNNKQLLGGSIDLASVVKKLSAGRTSSFTFSQKGSSIKVK